MAGATRMDTKPGSSSSSSATKSEQDNPKHPLPNCLRVNLVDDSLGLHTLWANKNNVETCCSSLLSVLTTLVSDRCLPQELHTLLIDRYTSSFKPAPTAYAPAGSTQPHSSVNMIGDFTVPLQHAAPAPSNQTPSQSPILVGMEALLNPAPYPSPQNATGSLGHAERSQWPFYAIKKGLQHKQLHTMWEMAKLK
eukprot:892262-Ditylum_brightwellii.AAC.1